MRLTSVSLRTRADAIRLSGEVEPASASAPFELYFDYPIECARFVSESADAFAVAMLIPAMMSGEPLEIVPPISRRLQFELPRIRDIFHSWHPEFSRCAINVTARAVEPSPHAASAATFFSGGVDSFYTLLKYRNGHERLPSPLTHVVFMRGLEKPLDFMRGVEDAQARVQRIAGAAGVRLIVGESNLRAHFKADWLNIYCGSGLVAAALSLANGFTHVCIPSAFSYRDAHPTSTTPLVDERFSTESLRIIHDGAELGRAEKLARIVDWNQDLVLQNLRVCVMNFGGVYNCCECRKCVRTMMALRILGVFDRAETFPNKSTAHWEAVAGFDDLIFLEENLALARTRGRDPEMMRLLERLILQRRRKDAIHAFLQNSPLRSAIAPIQAWRRNYAALKQRLRG